MLPRKPLSLLTLLAFLPPLLSAQAPPPSVFGYADFSRQAAIEQKFLAVPDAQLAGLHLKTLTAEPHRSATPGDRKTAEYVAQNFRAAGLDTEIVPYRVLLNQPKSVSLQVFSAAGQLLLSGPTREHVDGDPFQDDPRIGLPFNGSSASGDVTGEVVYANYGRLEDFNLLAARHIDLHGKIVLCRYGANFRGVKVYIAEQRGAAAVLLYSDPADDGYARGKAYPLGPWRPETAIQLGSVQYLFQYPGDPETPGVASTLDLPDSTRVPNQKSGNQPRIVSVPISYHDASPILSHLKGPGVPQGWQGALPFHYHLGPTGVRVHLAAQQDYQRRIIWDVIGKVNGAEHPDESVVVGNHRDAWIYGAVDPSSGTAALLEAVHGIGVLLHQGWHPKRTIVFCSWDAEEQGLVGSTEWVEQHAATMDHAVAYFNVDTAVAGPDFSASAVPSLKQFVRDITKSVPSPLGGTVYDQWKASITGKIKHMAHPPTQPLDELPMGDLGSGSDYTPFLQHAGVPSADIGSGGPYGVYHSVFDNFAWYTLNADPKFVYLQQMARVLGLEALRMADTDVLPFDYPAYARQIAAYIDAAKKHAAGLNLPPLDFAAAQAAAARLAAAAASIRQRQLAPAGDLAPLNLALRKVETDLLTPSGLPSRPWYRHTIYAPGQFTGYAAVELPGVSEAVDAADPAQAQQQLAVLAQALNRAANTLDSVH